MTMHLECPHCNDTHEVKKWNKEVQNSLMFGRCEELIPENMQADEWDDYANAKSGIVDCPSCEEVCCFEDMKAY